MSREDTGRRGTAVHLSEHFREAQSWWRHHQQTKITAWVGRYDTDVSGAVTVEGILFLGLRGIHFGYRLTEECSVL
jgi:hypothetical protein